MAFVVVVMKSIITCLQILECGGNLFDAVSLAVKAALHNTRIPKVKAASMDGAAVDLQLSDDPFDCYRLDVSATPCLVTLCKVNITWSYCPCCPDCVVFVLGMKNAGNCSGWSLVVGICSDGPTGPVTTGIS
jgi:exosome complex component RRP42